MVFGSLLSTVTLFSFMRPPKVTVADILRDPGYYDGKKVELEGVVLEYVVSPDEIACYLKGGKDSIIRIELKSPLIRVYCKFLVTGIVHLDVQEHHVRFMGEDETIRLFRIVGCGDDLRSGMLFLLL